MDLSSFRNEFRVVENLVYLNHAAVAPLPRRCQAGMEEYLNELTAYGAARYPGRVFETLQRVRALGAGLLGTRAERIFIVRSTTQGLGIAATGIPFAEGDNVVLVEKEFPANLRPWLPLRRRGVDVRLVPQRGGRVRLEDLDAAMDHRTRAVSLSHVQFLSGFRVDLGDVAQLCRGKGRDALLVVDAIQGLGVVPVDVEGAGVDFLSADAHKWLLGPEGVGLGYVSPRALDRIEPALEGWLSVKDPFDFFDLGQPLKSTAARFEEGAYNLAGIHGLEGSLQLIREVGVPALHARVLALTDELCDRLRGAGWTIQSPRDSEGEKSGIVLADRSGIDFDALRQRLVREGIVVSFRGGALRISPHGYNTEEEIERLLAALPET
jgi:selenocysteine lyase/cysteine desulfurase